jgi:hypothetical protein
MDNQLELYSKEKQLLKDSLASFDQEQNQMDPAHFDKVRVKRIKELEGLFEELKLKFAESAEKYEAELRQKDSLLETLGLQIDELEKKLGEGLYNPLTTRILQLDSNPTHQHIQLKLKQFSSLLSENQKLRAQVTNGSVGTGVPLETLKILESDLEQLRKELHSRDTSIARLKQVFMAKIAAFRRFVLDGLGKN